MKAFIEEHGDIVIGCVAAGAWIVILVDMLSGGAIRDAFLQFAGSIC